MLAANTIGFDRVFLLTMLILSATTVGGCTKSGQAEKAEVLPGQYYSFQCADGGYKVLKVLAVEENLIHVCYYNNTLEEKPAQDVIPTLYFGKKQWQDMSLSVEGSRQTEGRRHIALTLENWEYWEPDFLVEGEVTSDELKAYEEWKKGDRFVSGLLIKPTQ